MVLPRLPDCAHQAEYCLRKRGPSNPYCAGGRRSWHCSGPPGGTDPARKRLNVYAAPLVYRGEPLGRWQTVAWDPQRFLAPYAERFIEELSTYSPRNYPNRDLTRRAPPMPQPREPTS